MKTISLPPADVKFREDLYPRLSGHDPALVARYAEDVSVLPPIEVNQHHELIDGRHRCLAHRQAGVDTLQAAVTETESDAQLLELAIQRNASHGLQLSRRDKQDLAKRLYASAGQREKKALKERLPGILSVDPRTLNRWLARTVKDENARLREKAFDLYLRCHTFREIGETLGVPYQTVQKMALSHIGHLSDLRQNLAAYAGEDWPPYNVWSKRDRSNEVGHPGNSESEWTDRLVRAYTDPFGIVVDPFGGGGATLDVCRRRTRRCLISDLSPIPAREHEIRRHDITEGALRPPEWKDVQLVFLDPPYWRQKEYGGGPADLSASADATEFNFRLIEIVQDFQRRIHDGCRVALMIQPTQWKAEGRGFEDHMAALLAAIGMPIEQRIQAPYQSQQCTPQMVEWAKAERQWLVLSREIVVWRR